jgi:hypothetical protein
MTRTTTRKHTNDALHTLGLQYHDGLPIGKIDAILAANGFNETEPAIYCGREGRVSLEIGDKQWLQLSWYKMESGRYEIVAYVA